jgi:hypothetical protein
MIRRGFLRPSGVTASLGRELIMAKNLHRVITQAANVARVLVERVGIAFPYFSLPSSNIRLLNVLLITGLPGLWAGRWLAHPSPTLASLKRRWLAR